MLPSWHLINFRHWRGKGKITSSLGPGVSRNFGNVSAPKSCFVFVVFAFTNKDSIIFENDAITLSVEKQNWLVFELGTYNRKFFILRALFFLLCLAAHTETSEERYWSEKSAFCGQHLNSRANIFKDFLLSLTKLFFSCPFIFLVFSFNFSRITYALKRLKNFFKNFACEQCALNNWPRLGKVFHSLTSNNSKSLHAFELFFPVF